MVSARTPAFPVCRRCGLDLAVPHELNLCRHRRLVGRGHNCPKLSPVVQWARPEVSDIQASGDVGQCCTWQRSPAVALGLKHHSRRAVAVQNGRDDASVQIAEAVVMLGPRHERRCHNPIARVAAELQSLRVAWPAAEAAQARIQPFLDAEAMADPTGSHKVSVPRVAATSGQAPDRVRLRRNIQRAQRPTSVHGSGTLCGPMPGGATPVARRLPGLGRYQRAIVGWLEKAAAGSRPDDGRAPGNGRLPTIGELPESGRGGEDAGAVRWMIEGRGVSLIAQTVGIPVPVSRQRIRTDLDQPATRPRHQQLCQPWPPPGHGSAAGRWRGRRRRSWPR